MIVTVAHPGTCIVLTVNNHMQVNTRTAVPNLMLDTVDTPLLRNTYSSQPICLAMVLGAKHGLFSQWECDQPGGVRSTYCTLVHPRQQLASVGRVLCLLHLVTAFEVHIHVHDAHGRKVHSS